MPELWFINKIHLYVNTYDVGAKGKLTGTGHRKTYIQAEVHIIIGIDRIRIT